MNKMVLKGFPESFEGGLPGAVSGSYILHLECLSQRLNNSFDLRIARDHEMESSSDEVDARVDRARLLHDFVNAGMRTPHDEDQTVGSVDRQRELS